MSNLSLCIPLMKIKNPEWELIPDGWGFIQAELRGSIMMKSGAGNKLPALTYTNLEKMK